LVDILESSGLLTQTADDADRLWKTLDREPLDFVYVSESVLSPPVESAIEAIRRLPETPGVIVVCDRDDAETRARLLGAGCDAVLYSGMSDEAVGEIVAWSTTRRHDVHPRKPESLRTDALRLGSFRSQSPVMQQVVEVAQRVVSAQSSVLFLGETGVGKEHLARAIHEQGPRGNRPFVPVNCAAIPDPLVESELFGHERGAFTGAVRAHRGTFEMAHGGTVFLDEIGDTPLHVQAKLLRVLQDRKIQRVGAESMVPVDVRVMAATNQNLEHAIRDGSFRADLFYRVGVVSITVPPLRERREDIPDLVRSFLALFCNQLVTDVVGIEDSCMRALIEYEWPGNIRELINVIERAVLVSDGPMIGRMSLPDSVRGDRPVSSANLAMNDVVAPAVDFDPLDLTLRDARARVVEAFERDYLARQLERAEGRIGVTAKRSGITARALFEKMRRYGLRKEDFKG